MFVCICLIHGLNKEDNEFICHYFKEKSEIEASVQKKENKYYTILIESKSLTDIVNEIGKLMPKSMLYKLNYNFENNDNLNAIEFNQIDQRTYFTLQIKCDKIN